MNLITEWEIPYPRSMFKMFLNISLLSMDVISPSGPVAAGT
jgi:hypothetical protein